MSTSSFELEINTEYRTAVRFPAWVVLGVFSMAALISLMARVKSEDRGSEERWSMAVTSLSFIMGTLATAAYLFVRGIFVGQIPEAVMVALTLAFWGCGLPAIMNPDNAIAVRAEVVEDNETLALAPSVEIDNANLYFSCWIAFAAAVFLAGSLAQETMGVDVRTMAQDKQARWFSLGASAMVVLFASVRIYRNDEINCGDSEADLTLSGTEFCRRTNLGISLGVLTFLAAMLNAFGGHVILQQLGLSAIAELAMSAILMVMWTFGVGFITFGGDLSPGTHIGNLYFATWISFALTVMLFSTAFRDFVGGSAQSTSSSDANGDPDLGEPAPPPTQIPDDDDV